MKKNIAIIENHIISTNTVRQKLTQVLMQSGYNVTVLSTGTEKELAIARSKGFNVIDVKTSNTNPLHVFSYMRNIKNALKQTNTDVCLTFTMRPAIWGNIVCRSLRIKGQESPRSRVRGRMGIIGQGVLVRRSATPMA